MTNSTTKYKITHQLRNKDLASTKIEVKDLSLDELSKDDVFGLTAFVGDSTDDRDRLMAQMENLAQAIGWETVPTASKFESDTYGIGWAINLMKELVAPKVSEDDMNGFISSIAGSASI